MSPNLLEHYNANITIHILSTYAIRSLFYRQDMYTKINMKLSMSYEKALACLFDRDDATKEDAFIILLLCVHGVDLFNDF